MKNLDSRKLDRSHLFMILKSCGTAESVYEFIDEMEYLLKIDQSYFSKRTSMKDQYNSLISIINAIDPLLATLNSLRFDQSLNITPAALEIVNLIYDSLFIIQEQRSQPSNLNEKSPVSSHSYGTHIPLNYPTPLIEPIQELRDAISHAANKIKPQRGGRESSNPEYIRKRALADFFVTHYRNKFGKLPETTAHKAAHTAFIELIYATGMKIENDFHYLRSAINKQKLHNPNP